jgi:hypothetical protein
MRASSLVRTVLVVALAASSAAVVACGGAGNEPKSAVVTPGDMPDGANWDGVYFNSVYGNLHIVKTGDTIAGKWKRANGSAWGELAGHVAGNVVHFEWTEHKTGAVGPNATSKGKGVFQYKRPTGDNVDDELKGSWGLDENESGNEWDCVKQRNMPPDLKSIGGDRSDIPVNDWK